MAKILHAADFHLDSAFRALPEEKARLRRQESRQLPGRLVDWANDHGAELLLLAGDLFDSDQLYSQTAEELAAALGRFRGVCVIAPGNHDWLSPRSPYRQDIWPENVHIFRSRDIECLPLPQYGCTVYGAAFTSPEEAESGLAGFQPRRDGTAQILLLHGEAGSRESHYRPIAPEELANIGVDYLALGHVHACSGMNRSGDCTWAYPGCPEGRGFDELGDKGFLFGEVEPGRAELHFVPLAGRRYQMVAVDLTEAEDVLAAIRRSLPPDTQNDIYRIRLQGQVEQPPRLERLQQELAGDFFQLELRDETRPREDIWAACGEDSLRGQFLLRLRQEYDTADESRRHLIEQAARYGLAAMDNREL